MARLRRLQRMLMRSTHLAMLDERRSTMLDHDALILFIMHDIETLAVLERKHICTPFKVSETATRNKSNQR